jgi:recombination protein RecT
VATTESLRAGVAERGGTPAKRTGPASVQDLIESMRPEFARVLPSTISPDRLARIALTELRRVPKLGACEPASLLGALMTCAQLGLEPGPLGEVYLVPYGREVTTIIGYRGLIKLARQSKQIRTLSAHAVHERDEFRYAYGTEPYLIHKPALDDPGRVIAFYAAASFTAGGSDFRVLSTSDVDRTKSRSKASASGPWVTDYEAMGCKTALRRLASYLPMSTETATAIAVDETARTVAAPSDIEDDPTAALAIAADDDPDDDADERPPEGVNPT